MKLSMEIIAAALGEDVTYSRLLPNAGMEIDRYALLDHDLAAAGRDSVVICPSTHLPSPSDIPDGCNLICSGDPPHDGKAPVEFGNANVICCSGLSASRLVNKVISMFDGYRSKEAELKASMLEGACLEEIIERASELVGAPVFIMDMNRNMLTAGGGDPEADSLWRLLKKGYGPDYKRVAEAVVRDLDAGRRLDGGFMHATVEVLGRPIMAKTMKRGAHPAAVIAMMGQSRPGGLREPPRETGAPPDPLVESADVPGFARGRIRLFAYMVDLMGKELDMFKVIGARYGDEREQLLASFLNGESEEDPEEFEREARRVGLESGVSHLLGIVYSAEGIEESHAHLLVGYINELLPGSTSVALDSRIYVFFDSTDHFENWVGMRRRYAAFLETYRCKWLVGSPFKSLVHLPNVRRQMDEVVDSLSKDPAAEVESHYYDSACRQAVEHFQREFPYMTLRHPVLRILELYDRENGTDLLDTFRVLLENNCNVALTAAKLNLHRNSVQYRVKRIREIVGVEFVHGDFDEFEVRASLLFSFAFMDSWKESPDSGTTL